MTERLADKVWMNGELVGWDDAKIHIASHVVHYGSSVFEGIRCYDSPQGSRIFRLREHIRRLFESARIYRMQIPYSSDAVLEACRETVRANGFRECYIRPVVYRGMGGVGVNPLKNRTDLAVLVWQWGKYLGHEALASGIDVCVSSWTRMGANSLPPVAKCAANYMNSQLIKMEAIQNGYAEGIALNEDGTVSEGSGENLFLVRDGALLTPPADANVLMGITRDSVRTIAADLGIETRECPIPRGMLYIADEAFFTGTAAEISPIRSIDKIPVGAGEPGPITRKLQEAFFGLLKGERTDKRGWLSPL
ncbi:MAG: branched-chain amino acid transaminase [Candidatus Eisenbacteria bacterium]|nr:branched-chain amino acid transaminase [Candidatus Eisenbacteria bacterium]